METYLVPKGRQYEDWNDVFNDSQEMKFSSFNTGRIYGALENYTQRDSLPDDCDPTDRDVDYAVMVFHLRHPKKGDILIDAGFDRSFHDHPPFGNLPLSMKVFQRLKRIRYTQEQEDEDLLSHLSRRDIRPEHVFLTHMHGDHTAGVPALPASTTIYYGKNENSFYYRRLTTGSHLRGKNRVYLLDFEKGSSIAPFDKLLDIFGDGTFWALSTPGHTRDHISYFINATQTPVLITGDAELTKWGMENGVLMSSDYGEKGEADVRHSAEMIRTFHETYPQVEIWFSHDEQHS